jgi:hypothetical protein
LEKKLGEVVKYYADRTTNLGMEMGISFNKMAKTLSRVSGTYSRI